MIKIKCGHCGHESNPNFYWQCQACGAFFLVIIQRRLQKWILQLARRTI